MSWTKVDGLGYFHRVTFILIPKAGSITATGLVLHVPRPHTPPPSDWLPVHAPVRTDFDPWLVSMSRKLAQIYRPGKDQRLEH